MKKLLIATANVYILEKGAEVTTESGDVSTDEPVAGRIQSLVRKRAQFPLMLQILEMTAVQCLC